jgi:hypothetical protein
MSTSKVACIHGSPSHAAYLLHLNQRGLPFPASWVGKTCYPDVVMAVAQGEAPYGVVLKSVWDGMMTLRDRVRPFHATNTRALFHVFMAAPAQRFRAGEIRQGLTTMHRDARGAAVLARLGCSEIVSADESDLARIEAALCSCGLRAAA